MKTNQFALLGTKRFLPIFVTQFLGAFNDNVFKNALVILITYRVAEIAGINSQILVTLAAGVFIFPFFMFSATAGQLADKYEKSRMITIVKSVEIMIMMAATVGFYFNNIPILMLILFLLGMQAAFFGPLKYSILPEQLHQGELIAGNGLVEAGTFMAILLGTILGGILILRENGVLLISMAVCLIAMGGFFSSLFVPKTAAQNKQLKVSYNIFKETDLVLRYSKNHHNVFLAIMGISWFWMAGAIFLAEFPVLTKDALHANENVVALFFSLFSIGIAIGSLLCNKLLNGKVHGQYVPYAALGLTLFTLDLYYNARTVSFLPANELMTLMGFLQTTHGIRIIADILLIAICGGLYTVPLYAILQQRSQEAYRARVIASNNVMNALFMVLAALITMLILYWGWSISDVFLFVAIANAGVGLYIFRLRSLL